MNHDRRQAIEMRFGNVFNEIDIRNVAKTLVMDNDVVAFAPIWFVIDAHAVVPSPRAFQDDVPRNVGARADPFG